MINQNAHLQEKRLAIVNEVLQFTEMITANVRKAYPPKRSFRKKDRRPLKRILKNRAKVTIGMLPIMTEARIIAIISQPIPKFPAGRPSFKDASVVGQNGQEIITTLDGKLIEVPEMLWPVKFIPIV